MTFRLASLLRVRRLQADAAAAAAGAATARSAQAQRDAAARRVDLAAAAAAHHVDEWQFRSAVAARSARASLLTESVALAEAAQETAAGARTDWAQARRAVRTLERLEERHLAAQVAAHLAAEQLVLDEHGSRAGSGPGGPAGAVRAGEEGRR